MEEKHWSKRERGKNVLEDEKKESRLEDFLAQLNDPLIFILFFAAGVSLLLREYGDMAIILAVVLVNAVIGVVQEGRAEKGLGGAQGNDKSACAYQGGQAQQGNTRGRFFFPEMWWCWRQGFRCRQTCV